jgi:hypothetical protein
VQVPAGNKVAMETVGAGDITYECKAKAMAHRPVRVDFVGPDAKLMDRGGKQVGKYYGPPATWENMDGSKVTATQVAVAPAGRQHPVPARQGQPGHGQRRHDRRHLHPARGHPRAAWPPPCPVPPANMGAKQVVQYQADYIFYKAM